MTARDIERRFGAEAAQAADDQIGSPPAGDPAVAPAGRDRARGALIGAAVGGSLGLPVEGWSSKKIAARFGRITGRVAQAGLAEDTLLALITADSLLADPVDHPKRFARRLAGLPPRFGGGGARTSRRALRRGAPWWSASASGSAGTAAAARCVVFGLRWTGDPSRAAYEAALSAMVTHGHPAASSAAAAAAAGVALAAAGSGPLGAAWLMEAAGICSRFNQRAVKGVRLDARLRQMLRSLNPPPDGPGRALRIDSLVRRAGEMLGRTSPLATEAVPAAFWYAANARTPEEGVLSAVNAGGASDTVAAMTGAFLGARFGEDAWPDRLTEFYGLGEVRDAADRLSRPPSLPFAPIGALTEGGAPRPKITSGDLKALLGKVCIHLEGAEEGIAIFQKLTELYVRMGAAPPSFLDEFNKVNQPFLEILSSYRAGTQKFLLRVAADE